MVKNHSKPAFACSVCSESDSLLRTIREPKLETVIFLDCSHDSGHFGVIPELAEKASLRKTRICGDADIRAEPLGKREYRRSLQVDLACDLLGGFSRYLRLFCITGPCSNGSL
jgi:hypothetical protein